MVRGIEKIAERAVETLNAEAMWEGIAFLVCQSFFVIWLRYVTVLFTFHIRI